VTEIETPAKASPRKITPRLFEAFATYGKAQGTGWACRSAKKLWMTIMAKSAPAATWRGAIFPSAAIRRRTAQRLEPPLERAGLHRLAPFFQSAAEENFRSIFRTLVLAYRHERIRLLPEQVANQIAAGEVVGVPRAWSRNWSKTRFDARADRITVEIQAGDAA